MTQEEIKRKRVESVLKEVIPEALATLDDSRINALLVTEVVCSKGRNDARVYLDKSFFTEKEQGEALRQLRSVAGYIQNHCKQSEGWFKSPRLTFEFDEQLEKISRMEALFDQISQKGSSDKEGDDNE
ncbi:MAG TPA: 30S ribosome-binding factor RbfA [Epsilonproteobacteria bacterium]|nr:30S ribosome-binding factor RbfA [Campylobacterota bacterium]